MATFSCRAYLVGTAGLRDRLIAELAAAGVAAVAGGGVPVAAWAGANYRPRLVFVRGEPVPNGVVPTALRRCHHHRDRNEAISARSPTLDGTVKLCAECREERLTAHARL